MDHDGVSLGKPGTTGRLDLALYASFTVRKGKPVLWYPERKFFLLGRVIGKEWFAPASSQPDKIPATASGPAADGQQPTGASGRTQVK